jgi:hypothetical protein
MIDQQWTGRNLDGRGCGLLDLLFCSLTGETEEDLETSNRLADVQAEIRVGEERKMKDNQRGNNRKL